MKTRTNQTNRTKSVLTTREMLMVRGGTRPTEPYPK
jgi:hypothetical protein